MTRNRARNWMLRFVFVVICTFVGCRGNATSSVLLITSGGDDRVYLLDAETGQVRDTIDVDPRPGENDEPHGITSAPNGDFWYVTVAHGEPTLWKFSWPQNRRVGRVPLGLAGASRMGITSDGETGFVADYYRDDSTVTGKIAIVRLHDLHVQQTIPVCVAPHDAQVNGAGTTVAVACSSSNELVLLDTRTWQTMHRVSFASTARQHPGPLNLAWPPGDSTIVVTLHRSAELAVYHVTEDRWEAVPVGSGPAQIAVLPRGDRVITANRLDGSVSIVDLNTKVEVNRIDLGVSYPHGVTVAADGVTAFITYEGTTDTYGGIVALNLHDLTVTWTTEIGQYVLGVSYITD